MTAHPRVAFLPDTFHEVNGVALTSRQLEAFARRRQIPFLSIHPGPVNETVTDGPVTIRQLQRGPASVPLDTNLPYDLLMGRYANSVVRQIKQFGAEVIHLTGPGDMGTLGLYAAWRLRLPLVISWHTSLHEYASRRLERLTAFLGHRLSHLLGFCAEQLSLGILLWFYHWAKIILAPNPEVIDFMQRLTRRPVSLMQRGVETDLFSPVRRHRANARFRIGYVGRLTTEKNVRFLAELSRALVARGHRDFEFVIIGQGIESVWLRENVVNATLPGVVRGIPLAEAYADMDLFVFPSATDTFGNVILEALASGVPAVVTSSGGPKFLIQHGITGYVASSGNEFIEYVSKILLHPETYASMRKSARAYAESMSWDSVFEKVFDAYGHCVKRRQPLRVAEPVMRLPA